MGWASLLASSPSPAAAIPFLVIILLSFPSEYSSAAVSSSSNGGFHHHLLFRPPFTASHIFQANSVLRQSQSRSSSSNGSYGSTSHYTYETLFYTQTLDHFSFTPSSYRTFQQRYLVNRDHWGGGKRRAPIFVYCGNEGDIEWFASNTGFLWEIAPLYSAMVVFMEHRYYGMSIPDILDPSTHSAETLGYLTSEQALADYAELIRDLKRNHSAQDSPIVLFGGSYGGMLAAWFRLKYPHVAVGALAASAPILQFEGLVPLDGFYRIVSEDFKNASTSCFDTIKASWDALNAAYEKPGGQEKVAKLLGFCSNVSADLSSVQGFLETAWVYMAMTDYPYPSNFLQPMPANPVETACKAMDSLPQGSDILARIAAGANVYYNGTGEVSCFGFGSDPHGMSLWSWQACTEMVMPMSSNPNNSMFPEYSYSLESTLESCSAFYGVSPRPNWITLEFGGANIHTVLKQFASNIVFSNGMLDPWSNGGVLSDISDTVVALVTSKGAHHVDLRAATDKDPEWLVQQREEEKKHISRWLHQYYADIRAAHQ